MRAADIQSQTVTAFTTGGTSTAYTLTPTPAITTLAANQRFRVTFHVAAGTSPTLSISGLTAKPLKYKDATGTKQAITSVQVPSGWASDVEYDGTDYVVLSIAEKNKPAFSVYKSANQTGVVTGTYTLVTWDVEEFDTNNNFASNRFTPTVPGYYLLTSHILWATGVDQSPYFISIYKNGALYKSTRFVASSSSVFGSNFIEAIVSANGTTDYFEIYVRHDAGTNQSLIGDNLTSVFSGILL
jgi:hypothetical protein